MSGPRLSITSTNAVLLGEAAGTSARRGSSSSTASTSAVLLAAHDDDDSVTSGLSRSSVNSGLSRSSVNSGLSRSSPIVEEALRSPIVTEALRRANVASRGTHSDDDSVGSGFARPSPAEVLRRVRLPETVAEDGEDEEGDDDDGKTTRARIFDRRRIYIIGVAFVIIVLIAVVSIISSRQFAKPPPEFSTSAAKPFHLSEDGYPRLHMFSWVFVAYDKFGYTVADQFCAQLRNSIDEQDRLLHRNVSRLQKQFIDPRSQFNPETQCTDFNLERNTVTIFESPEFHCSMKKLRSLFMDHEDHTQKKLGVKLIHLVRNPFSMAVATYRDRRSVRAPEEVRFKNPCSSLTQAFTAEGGTNWSVAGLNAPLLSRNGIMSHKDFEQILANCKNIYQTRPGLEGASYQQHLMQLPPADGLQLAVADGLNGVANMASGLIAFDRVDALVEEETHKNMRYFDIMTVPLDEILEYPGNSMVEFLDFVFGEYMSASSKHKAAADYELNRIGEDYPTDAEETQHLIRLLRNDPLLAGPLTRVESLMESVLSEQDKNEAEG